MARNYYDVLEVKHTASVNEIRASYRRLAVRWHPDRNNRPDATARMQEINAAFDCLKDPLRRRMYDETLRRRGHQWTRAHQSKPEQGRQSKQEQSNHSKREQAHQRQREEPPRNERARQAPPRDEWTQKAPPRDEPHPSAEWGNIVILKPETLLAAFSRIDDFLWRFFGKQRRA